MNKSFIKVLLPVFILIQIALSNAHALCNGTPPKDSPLHEKLAEALPKTIDCTDVSRILGIIKVQDSIANKNQGFCEEKSIQSQLTIYCLAKSICYLDLEKLIGQGGDKNVFKGLKIDLQKNEISESAILYAKKGREDRFEKEIQINQEILNKLEGKAEGLGLVENSFVSKNKGLIGFMPLFTSGSLEAIVDEGFYEEYELSKKMISSLANGLNLMYKNNCFHRDIKPANIFLSPKPNKGFDYFLADFGYATCKDTDFGKMLSGTIQLTSPDFILDLFNNQGQMTKEDIIKDDIFQLGIALDQFQHGHSWVIDTTQYFADHMENQDVNAFKKAKLELLVNFQKKEKELKKISDSHNKQMNVLILKMLHPDKNKRIIMDELIEKISQLP